LAFALYSNSRAQKDQSLSYSQISSRLGVSKSSVSKYLKIRRDKIPVNKVKKSGRPRKVGDEVRDRYGRLSRKIHILN
jgi:transposase